MVKAPLVVPDIEFGERILAILDAASFPATVVLWLKEDDDWQLVIGSPLYESAGPQGSYLKLIDALSSEGPVSLSELHLQLKGHQDPFIKDLRRLFGKTASVEGMRLGGHQIGGYWIDDAYVYRIR